MFCHSLVLLSQLILLTTGYPIYEDSSFEQTAYTLPEIPKWHNHCKESLVYYSDHLDSDDYSNNIMIQDYFRRTAKTAKIAMRSAQDLRKRFASDFQAIIKEFEDKKKFEWLPNETEFSTNFKEMEGFVALGIVHRYVEIFAVAFEQMVFDQKYYRYDDYKEDNQVYKGNYFKNVQENNYSMLCEIRITLAVVLQSNNEDFLKNTERSIMPEENRKIESASQRRFRDYVILGQYVRATQYINKLLEHFASV